MENRLFLTEAFGTRNKSNGSGGIVVNHARAAEQSTKGVRDMKIELPGIEGYEFDAVRPPKQGETYLLEDGTVEVALADYSSLQPRIVLKPCLLKIGKWF